MARIAIVDDNESWCFILQTSLQQQGFDVEVFSEPQRFLEEVERFELAIVDFCMPAPRYRREIDGVTLIKQIRKQLPQPPLLMLISSYFPEDGLDSLSSFCEEADLVLPRPRQIQSLLQPIQDLLAQRSSPFSTSQSAAPVSAAEVSLPGEFEQLLL